MDDKTLREAIRQVSNNNISDEDLSLLLSCATSRRLEKGEPLLIEGEICRSFYLVNSGYLRTLYNKDGIEINLDFTFEGEFTANLKSLKNRKPSDFRIEAGEDAAVWIFNLETIARQINMPTAVSIFVRRLAIRILLASEEHSNLFKMYTPTERYRFIEKNNPQLLQRISLSQMASYLGVARETLSRIRAKSV